MRRIVLAVFLLAAVAFAWGRRTTRPGLRPEPAPEPVEADALPEVTFESIVAGADSIISFAGYDKPLRSRRETFFATNSDTARTVERIWFTATYYDLSGRMLHRRSGASDGPVPPGQTRQLSTPSWDTQRTFYYYLSEAPARAVGTPYRVTLTVDSLLLR